MDSNSDRFWIWAIIIIIVLFAMSSSSDSDSSYDNCYDADPTQWTDIVCDE
jgi:hypothetical protein